MASHFLSRVRHGVRRLHSTLKLGSQAPSRILSVYGIVDALGGECGVSWVGIYLGNGRYLATSES